MTFVRVEVAYALPERQTLLALDVPAGTTVEAAVALSGIRKLHPDIDLASQRIGIFGRFVAKERAVDAGDRIEIYRPLIADPKASRHARVARKRAKRASDRDMRA
ncbi:MAG: RnfH family protein [Betaproteobacteria bacterium]